MMALRQPLPRLWLLTDERIGDALWPALAALPRGSGVIFRHYATPRKERRRLFEAVRVIARRRRLTLLLAGDMRQAIGWRADGVHGRSRPIHTARPLLRTAPAHGRRELIDARKRGTHLILLSPVFATRSHPGQASLGPVRFGLAAGSHPDDVIALGGMTSHGFRRLSAFGVHGWAAIDGLVPIIRTRI